MRRSFLSVFVPVFALAVALEGGFIAYHFMHPRVDTDALLRQGVEASRTGKYDLAIQDYNEVLKADPKSASAYTYRGIAYAWKKDYDKAIADYTAALAIRSDDVSIYYDLGFAYNAKHDEPAALKNFNTVVLFKPGEARGYSMRGRVYIHLKDYDRALADFQKAAELDPNTADAHHDVGYVYALKQDFPDAITEYGKAIDLYTLVAPNLPRAYLSRASAYRHLGNFDAALADCDKVLTFDAHNWNAHVQRGYIHVAMHDEANADIAFQQAFGMLVTDKQATLGNNVAWTLCTSPDAAIRDGNLAVKYAEKSCELSYWQHPEDIDTLAAACAETGDFDSAVKWEQMYLATPNLDAKKGEEAKPRLALYVAHQPFHEDPLVPPKVMPPPE
jgi:tetratricopeptide (TPR) repeat protein